MQWGEGRSPVSDQKQHSPPTYEQKEQRHHQRRQSDGGKQIRAETWLSEESPPMYEEVTGGAHRTRPNHSHTLSTVDETRSSRVNGNGVHFIPPYSSAPSSSHPIVAPRAAPPASAPTPAMPTQVRSSSQPVSHTERANIKSSLGTKLHASSTYPPPSNLLATAPTAAGHATRGPFGLTPAAVDLPARPVRHVASTPSMQLPLSSTLSPPARSYAPSWTPNLALLAQRSATQAASAPATASQGYYSYTDTTETPEHTASHALNPRPSSSSSVHRAIAPPSHSLQHVWTIPARLTQPIPNANSTSATSSTEARRPPPHQSPRHSPMHRAFTAHFDPRARSAGARLYDAAHMSTAARQREREEHRRRCSPSRMRAEHARAHDNRRSALDRARRGGGAFVSDEQYERVSRRLLAAMYDPGRGTRESARRMEALRRLSEERARLDMERAHADSKFGTKMRHRRTASQRAVAASTAPPPITPAVNGSSRSFILSTGASVFAAAIPWKTSPIARARSFFSAFFARATTKPTTNSSAHQTTEKIQAQAQDQTATRATTHLTSNDLIRASDTVNRVDVPPPSSRLGPTVPSIAHPSSLAPIPPRSGTMLTPTYPRTPSLRGGMSPDLEFGMCRPANGENTPRPRHDDVTTAANSKSDEAQTTHGRAVTSVSNGVATHAAANSSSSPPDSMVVLAGVESSLILPQPSPPARELAARQRTTLHEAARNFAHTLHSNAAATRPTTIRSTEPEKGGANHVTHTFVRPGSLSVVASAVSPSVLSTDFLSSDSSAESTGSTAPAAVTWRYDVEREPEHAQGSKAWSSSSS